MISICSGWEFTENWSEEFLNGGGETVSVRLPHTVRPVPLHYASPSDYEMICGYRRTLPIPEEYRGKRLFLQFDGAAHFATVYVNGTETVTHRCGYTAFRVEITDLVRFGEDNTVAVRLDSTENPAVPPFGYTIDYLTYGGLYREAWLDVHEQDYIEDIYVTTPSLDRVTVELTVSGGSGAKVSILDGETVVASRTCMRKVTVTVPGAKPWSPDAPHLYTCRAELANGEHAETTFGFRTAEFKADGLYLNGEKVFMRGLNRHQCYPYIGYAAPASLQREDARILKQELQCNTVRTSHYPQSQHFINECDRLGLLVFTEIPGWQHIGDAAWQEQACENVREMVLQYRNHPSIVLWGVRINESMDNDALYTRTNAIAHELDPSRATSGVRYLEQSSLLEDVYAFNDFSHTGDNPGVKPKRAATPDMSKALLVTECNGHMYPTKPGDDWTHRQNHALRHAAVQNDALADGEHAGCIGWCMFDYATHLNFGSGDRICYHGVLDSFRNPKLAAALYASQGEASPVLEIGSSMDVGDYPAGNIGQVYIFTNAEEVALYKNDNYVTTLTGSKWKALPHGPILLDDPIGCLLETQEGFTGKKEKRLHDCLLAAGAVGLANMSLSDKAKMGWCMLRYGLSFADGTALYGKYVGNWGTKATKWRFDAKIGGEVVASRTCCPGSRLHLEVIPSRTVLYEGDTYDMAAVRIRVVDENGSLAPYGSLPVSFKLRGPAELVGPATVCAEGGSCGTYIRTVGRAGKVRLTLSTPQTPAVTLEFEVK